MSTKQNESTTRQLEGATIPVAGTWRIDPGHTEVAFIGRHFMLTRVRGRFVGVSGAIEIAENPVESGVDVTIDMTSVESGAKDRDDHLRSADFFDVENFPTATYRSTSVDWKGINATVNGELTLVGVSRPVSLDVSFLGAVVDPWGGERAIFTASTEINREDWGLTWNVALEAGGILVSKKIRVEIEIEAVRQA